MSGDLHITFAPDMPAASVEVIAPDLEVIERIMLDAGRSRTVAVPSERTFLRVHLPSGQVVTLTDPGNLSRVISMQSILAHLSPARTQASRSPAPNVPAAVDSSMFESEESVQDLSTAHQLALYHTKRASIRPSMPGTEEMLPLGPHGTASITAADGKKIPGVSVARGREAQWEVNGTPQEQPLTLAIERPTGATVEVRLPGDVQRVWVRADFLREQGALTFSVRLSTSEPAADTILGYLQRGDFYSADAMRAWIDDARDMLLYKKNDPYAAAVGAYTLLRLKQFSHLHDWAKNLADWFPFLPDGCIVWAWQLLQQDRTKRDEVRDYLFKAVARGLPVYTEGLRLLIDGLRLLGDEGRAAYEEAIERAGTVLWDSPLTASIRTSGSYTASFDTLPVTYDIAFAAQA